MSEQKERSFIKNLPSHKDPEKAKRQKQLLER